MSQYHSEDEGPSLPATLEQPRRETVDDESGNIHTEEDDPEKELYESSISRISVLNKQGVTQGRTDIVEPGLERNPGLRNMEEYEDWIQNAEEYVTNRGRKQGGIVGELIEVEDIQKDVTTIDGDLKPCRHVSILGGAGTGKTTLARRIARDGARGKYEKLKGKLIVLPDFRTFSPDEKLLPSQLLLKDMFPHHTKADVLNKKYEWMTEHPEKVAFIIDSLDTLPFDLQHERPRIGHYKETTVDVLLHNLLAGDLFKKSDIISTSREYKVRNVHPSIRPDRCIVLEGLSKEASRDLINGFLGEEKGREMVSYIDTKCPDVWPMLSTPVCLVFSIIAFMQKGFRARTMTGILIKFFLSLLASPFATKKNLRETIRKLIPMSFKGIFNGRVLFTPEDLHSCGLLPEDVADIGILIPQSSGTYLSTKLMQNERFYLYFNHQTEQECLAALHILSISLKEYQSFVRDQIHEPRFTVVRRIVSGVLLDDEVLEAIGELVKISDVEERRKILLESLGNAMKSHRGPDSSERLPDLLIALSEAGGGVTDHIRSSLQRITLTNVPLSLSDVHAVASIMQQCTYLSSVCLTGCNMNDEKLDAIVGPVMQSSLKVNEFHSSDSDLGTEGIKKLAILVKHLEVKGLEVARNKLDADRLQVFRSAASGMKLNRLDVSGNVGIKGKGMFRLGELVLDFGVSNLKAEKCDLMLGDLENFSESSKDAPLVKLNVSGSKRLGPTGMHFLGKLVRNRGVRDLDTSVCNPTPQELMKLAEGLGDAKVDFLNLRNLVRKLPYTNALLSLIHRVKKQLNLQGWKINELECDELQNKLNEMPRSELEIMLDEGKEYGAFLRADPCDSAESDIDSLGGEVSVSGSRIDFLPDAFVDRSRISASSSLGESGLPEAYLTISRLLHFSSSLKPNADAMIKIPIWASTEDPDIMVKVLCKKDGYGEEWRQIKSMPLREIRDRIVKFLAGGFNWFVIAITEPLHTLTSALTFYAKGELSYDRDGNFETRFFVDGQANRDLDDSTTDRKVILFLNQRFSSKDIIQIKFTCEPEKFSFLWQNKEFVVDRRFLTGSKTYYFKMTLKPLPNPITNIAISYKVEQNGRSMAKDIVRITWPEAIAYTGLHSVVREDKEQLTVASASDFVREKHLGREGGSIENHGCKVTFPFEALEEDRKIETTVITKAPRRREDRVPVAPHFKCGPPGTLNKPVLIEMQLWLVPIKDDMYAEVYRKDGDDSEWEFVERVHIDGEGKISFHSDHFTVFEVLADAAYWVWSKLKGPSFKVPLRSLVFINGVDRKIACVCCLDDKAVKQEVTEDLKESGFIPLPYQEILQACHEVKVTISCIEPDNLLIRPELQEHSVREIEKVFTPIEIQANRSKYYCPTFQRQTGSMDDYRGSLRFKYSLVTDGAVQEPHEMHKEWPISPSSQVRDINFLNRVKLDKLF